MTTTQTRKTLELEIKYYRSFVSYEIPFQPDGEIPFAETQGLRSYYIGSHDKEGRVVQFVKIGLVRDEVRTVEFPEREKPGSTIFFRVVRPPKDGGAQVGKRITYVETEKLPEFFEGEVKETGRSCQLTLFRKQEVFKDVYRYWPNGKLKERTLLRGDGRKSIWHYDEEGNPIQGKARQE